eukprot:900940-Prorocentrum_minimum.AAC.2
MRRASTSSSCPAAWGHPLNNHTRKVARVNFFAGLCQLHTLPFSAPLSSVDGCGCERSACGVKG